mmetsp:Transcript_19068/g.51241  ORF Transcript_19068/g.51241 Transcript_19068/m.51241 type:complete len:288 (+) Transcript_19068:275-1138(+)
MALGATVADHREEHVVADLHEVDVEDALVGGDEGKVDGVGDGPHLPRARHLHEELVLDARGHCQRTLALSRGHVAEEHDAENGVPEHLVDEHLGRYLACRGAGDERVEIAVEPVPGGTMDESTEGGEAREASPVEAGLLGVDKLLHEDVADGEAGEGGERLGENGLLLKHGHVARPDIAEDVFARVTRLAHARGARVTAAAATADGPVTRAPTAHAPGAATGAARAVAKEVESVAATEAHVHDARARNGRTRHPHRGWVREGARVSERHEHDRDLEELHRKRRRTGL